MINRFLIILLIFSCKEENTLFEKVSRNIELIIFYKTKISQWMSNVGPALQVTFLFNPICTNLPGLEQMNPKTFCAITTLLQPD